MTPEQQLKGFIAKFAPPNQRLIRALRKAVRKRLPAANELVYDNYNFLVIAYCPTQKPAESYFSIGADKSGANLFFAYNGTKLKDSKKRLQGKGALNRFVRLESEESLADVEDLIAQAVALSKGPAQKEGQLVIRMISPKQRPRR
jgi:hypothetical protein